ncbi:MAG: prolyl oligopeptidase family serine peptidase [Saprospiraceae bacterium]|nr:prolyl oligopeptidase family serine peptidase [Saprospiraceae bacterium]
MRNWKFITTILLLGLANLLVAQKDVTYQTPPKAIADLIDAPLTPTVSIGPDEETILLLSQPGYPSIEEVSQEELRIAGIRINPKNNASSRAGYSDGMKLQSMSSGKARAITGLPQEARIQNVQWSVDGKKIAFTNNTATGVELWMVDVATAAAKKLTEAIINDAIGSTFEWLPDNQTILYKSILTNRGEAPKMPSAPKGPVVQANEGIAAPVRTYQDLLQNPHDADLFEYYTTSQLMTLNVATGKSAKFGEASMVGNVEPSPDGNYLLISTIKRPFSYIVPFNSFPQEWTIVDKMGKKVRMVADIPIAENIPKGFNATREGPRSFTWRADAPATLYWVEAQDGGDPKREVAVRDKMFYLEAPFSGEAKGGISFKFRYGGVMWGDGNLAMAFERWTATRQEVVSQWSPDKPMGSKLVVFDRLYEDRYNDPGSFETKRNQYGRNVLLTANDGKTLFLTGQGASAEGNRPFVDEFELDSKQTKRLWRSEAPYYEIPISIVDVTKGTLITRRESNTEPPNYFIRDLKTGKTRQLTNFDNPFKVLEGVSKELVKYKRADGIELSGTLYLPKDYNKDKDGPLPTFMWAYPREYKTADAASQVTGSPYEFTRISSGSPLFWITQGYAIFDGFSMPILGEGDQEPNETFVAQLRMNAESAINKLVEMGVTDRNRIGVGGHSYGAFMTANLLAHTDLFAAGIARSGAYNRTLTPFGFQSEERTFWEAPDVYNTMSPFMYADQIKEPILLIHGEADNNSGTFPIQSERFYAALKGHGATARLVMLPAESHGYRAKESIMHMLWEMNTWLDKNVKNRSANGKEIKP